MTTEVTEPIHISPLTSGTSLVLHSVGIIIPLLNIIVKGLEMVVSEICVAKVTEICEVCEIIVTAEVTASWRRRFRRGEISTRPRCRPSIGR